MHPSESRFMDRPDRTRRIAGQAAASRALLGIVVAVVVVGSLLAAPAGAQDVKPDPLPERFRGDLTEVDDAGFAMATKDGATVDFAYADNFAVFELTPASFTDVDFGLYVGSVSVRLDEYSPIVRDSLSWLHEGFELRIIDEALRGIALGHTHWDLTPDSVMTHGWVDDLEVRVLSIKYGPTEEEETDVDIPRDAPVLKMSLGDKSLLVPGAHVLVGARKADDGSYMAVFAFVGEQGVVPPM
jgi:hypothetical protein